MNNETSNERYNLVIIGGGPVGLAAALGAAQLGARVALIERNRLGGDSLLAGSAPTTTLVRAAHVAAEIRGSAKFGLRLNSPLAVDFPAVMARVRELHSQIAERTGEAKLRENGVDVFWGEGKFVDRESIEVEGRKLPFARAIIATGAAPTLPQIEGLDNSRCLTAVNLFTLNELPRRLAVIGAGTLGMELAQIFARFGSAVTVYEKNEQVLPHADPDAALLVQTSLEHEGVTFRLGYENLRCVSNSGFELYAQCEGQEFSDCFDHLLLACGRSPRMANLNLEAAGVDCEDNGILVNANLRTTSSHIFAAGTACSSYRFPYAAEALAQIAIANALFLGMERATDLLVPWCTFTDPEVAHVGLNESEAAADHLSTLRLPFDDLDRALLDSTGGGLLKIHHDHRGSIRGATLVGTQASEMIGQLVMAMRHDVRLSALASHIHPYPTQTEIIKRAGEMYHRTLLTPLMARLLKKFLKWRR